jgi:hypothetical protein
MALLDHVHPGDLITSQLLNEIIDRLNALQAQVDKCCADVVKPGTGPEPEPEPEPGEPPVEPEPRGKLQIFDTDPKETEVGGTVVVHGTGFIPKAGRNLVTLNKERVEQVLEETEKNIAFIVPKPDAILPARLRLAVSNENGSDYVLLQVAASTAGKLVVRLVEVKPTRQKVETGGTFALLFEARGLPAGSYLPLLRVTTAEGQDPKPQRQKAVRSQGVGEPLQFQVELTVPETGEEALHLQVSLTDSKKQIVWVDTADIRMGEPIPSPKASRDTEGGSPIFGGLREPR